MASTSHTNNDDESCMAGEAQSDNSNEELTLMLFSKNSKSNLNKEAFSLVRISACVEFDSRWNKSSTPLHCMAHSLVPKYYHESWLQGENGIQKLAPNEDNRDRFDIDETTNDLTELSIDEPQIEGVIFEEEFEDLEEVEEDEEWKSNLILKNGRLNSIKYIILPIRCYLKRTRINRNIILREIIFI
ncbi:hypothetical protein H5410_045016 [Solanum commersonii]|uniref:Uncharacterized protein n=1 Tax=Solanum commersonii TaxID=4109 RepID=A0A9J5XBE9_SOLCO|nr:hypothetical protein H5410_045016 [Solanum commersonii]